MNISSLRIERSNKYVMSFDSHGVLSRKKKDVKQDEKIFGIIQDFSRYSNTLKEQSIKL